MITNKTSSSHFDPIFAEFSEALEELGCDIYVDFDKGLAKVRRQGTYIDIGVFSQEKLGDFGIGAAVDEVRKKLSNG